jgi:ferredoxin
MGLGARLRRLARSQPAPATSDPSPEEQASERTVAVEIISRPEPEPELLALERQAELQPDPESPPAREPERSQQAPGSSRVLIVLDSEQGSISLEVEPGTTVLEAVQQAGLERGQPVDWECEDGGCGVCIVGVVEGADRMDPPDPASGEMQTIQITEQVAPDPKKYRLACLARVRGAVRLRKLT